MDSHKYWRKILIAAIILTFTAFSVGLYSYIESSFLEKNADLTQGRLMWDKACMMALEQNNSYFCERANEKKTQETCLNCMAIGLNDIEICEKIETTEAKGKCIYDIARKTENKEYCKRLLSLAITPEEHLVTPRILYEGCMDGL